MVQLLIDYTYKYKNHIILELNDKDDNGAYPLSLACNKNNNEMAKLLIDYANELKSYYFGIK